MRDFTQCSWCYSSKLLGFKVVKLIKMLDKAYYHNFITDLRKQFDTESNRPYISISAYCWHLSNFFYHISARSVKKFPEKSVMHHSDWPRHDGINLFSDEVFPFIA